MFAKLTVALVCTAIGLSANATEHSVQARSDLTFSPADIIIAPGDTVKFENVGGFHNVREVESDSSTQAKPQGFCAPLPGCAPSGAGWSSTVAFPSTGLFYYLCEVHGTQMRGTIMVTTIALDIFADGFEQD